MPVGAVPRPKARFGRKKQPEEKVSAAMRDRCAAFTPSPDRVPDFFFSCYTSRNINAHVSLTRPGGGPACGPRPPGHSWSLFRGLPRRAPNTGRALPLCALHDVNHIERARFTPLKPRRGAERGDAKPPLSKPIPPFLPPVLPREPPSRAAMQLSAFSRLSPSSFASRTRMSWGHYCDVAVAPPALPLLRPSPSRQRTPCPPRPHFMQADSAPETELQPSNDASDDETALEEPQEELEYLLPKVMAPFEVSCFPARTRASLRFRACRRSRRDLAIMRPFPVNIAPYRGHPAAEPRPLWPPTKNDLPGNGFAHAAPYRRRLPPTRPLGGCRSSGGCVCTRARTWGRSSMTTGSPRTGT